MSDNNYAHVSIPDKNKNPPAPKTYKGMSTVNGGKGWSEYDITLVRQDLINHFHIRQGEKLNDPTFGTIIWDMLFEPLTDQLKQLIVQDVNRIIDHDPRVRADSITLESYEYGIRVICDLTYLPYNISESLKFEFDQNSSFAS